MIRAWKPSSPVSPMPVSVLDIETDGQDVIGIGFAWYDGETHYESYESFDEWLDHYKDILATSPKEYRPLIRRIYAHYGAGFDWLFLIDWAMENELLTGLTFIASDSFPIGGRVKIKGMEKEGFIRLYDSFRLLPASLKALSKTFNVEYQKIELDMMPGKLKKVNEELFWQYLHNDVVGLQQIITAFWQMIYDSEGDIGYLPMTLPSLAMRLWTKGLEKPIKTTWNESVKQLERDSYVGGRTECYIAGETNTNIYDINSLYPSVMIGSDYPISYRGAWTNTYAGKHGIYEASFIQTNRERKPVLRDAESNNYLYEGSGTFCKPELDLFLRIGGTFKISRGFVYHDIGNPFQQFIATWWKRRARAQDDGDAGLAYVAKILMNSLYGKLAQKDDRQKIVYLTPDEQRERIKTYGYVEYIGELCIIPEQTRNENAFVAIASYVTSYARVRLYERIETAELNGGIVWYCDTDSVHVSGATLATSKELGGLKDEYDGLACYAGKKLYALHKTGTIKAKGIRKAPMLLTYNDIKTLAEHPDARNAVDYHTLPTYREVLSGKVKPGTDITRRRTLRQTA